jgi:LysM repeat protein
MARYVSSGNIRRSGITRNRIYVISGLLVVGVLIAFIYGNHPFGRSGGEPMAMAPDVDEPAQLDPVVAVDEPAPEPVQPDPEPLPQPPVEPEPTDVPSKPSSASDPQVAQLIEEAVTALNAAPVRIIRARAVLNEALPLPMTDQQRQFIKDQLSALADQWLFNKSVFPADPLCDSYRVEPGDLLSAIGKQYKVPYEILMQINNISRPEALRAGETIKIIKGPFHAKVYRSTFTMDLYLQNTFVCSYRVGLGQPDKETPTGLWRVKRDGKQIEPAWPDPVTGELLYPDDPGYALGSRWIGLDGLEGPAKGRTGFGIHGTKEPETIGTRSSRGCIRLHNGNVIQVYDTLVPVHSLVHVSE